VRRQSAAILIMAGGCRAVCHSLPLSGAYLYSPAL
jgi:hypothetical protein